MKQQLRTQEELPDFPFPLFVDNEKIADYDLTHKLPLELFLRHEGYRVTLGKKRYVLSIQNYHDIPKDTLTVRVSTWGGSFVRAVHCYGNMVIPPISFIECRTGASVIGYGIPTTLRSIKLYRGLTAEELAEKGDKYLGYKVGGMVPGFNTIDDVVKHAGVVATRHFPGFKLRTEIN